MEMRLALIALGHEKLWWREPKPTGRKKGVCEIVTWDNFVVARKDLDARNKHWAFTDKATVIFPCPPGGEPDLFDEELDSGAAFFYDTLYP